MISNYNTEAEYYYLRGLHSTLLEFFNEKRYPSKDEKRRIAAITGTDLQYVINFFYNTRSRVKKIEGKDKAYKHYQLAPDSLEIEPMDPEIQLDQLNEGCHYFYYGSENSLYKKFPFGNENNKLVVDCEMIMEDLEKSS